MRNYTETDLETHIESYLSESNSISSLSKAYKANKSIYDTERCILLNEFIEFIKITQKNSWEDFCKQYSINPEEEFVRD